jgi:hypothetical protein
MVSVAFFKKVSNFKEANKTLIILYCTAPSKRQQSA